MPEKEEAPRVRGCDDVSGWGNSHGCGDCSIFKQNSASFQGLMLPNGAITKVTLHYEDGSSHELPVHSACVFPFPKECKCEWCGAKAEVKAGQRLPEHWYKVKYDTDREHLLKGHRLKEDGLIFCTACFNNRYPTVQDVKDDSVASVVCY